MKVTPEQFWEMLWGGEAYSLANWDGEPGVITRSRFNEALERLNDFLKSDDIDHIFKDISEYSTRVLQLALTGAKDGPVTFTWDTENPDVKEYVRFTVAEVREELAYRRRRES